MEKNCEIMSKSGVPTCPVRCKYCMAQKINIRAKYWKNISRIGVNKSCVFFNRLPQDPKIEEMNFPWHLLDGEYLGFQGITDCFWEIFIDDLKFIADKVKNSKIRRLCLISKIPVNDLQIEILKEIKDKLVVCYSITGLDFLEETKNSDRISSLIKLREEDIDVLPVMHPYIDGVTDAEAIFKELNKYDFKYICWKGFRYNPENMKELEDFIDADILKKYICDEAEVLYGEDELLNLAEKYNLKYVDLKDYLHYGNPKKINDKKILNKDRQVIEKQVDELLEYCVFSTSGKKDDVRESCVLRRLE